MFLIHATVNKSHAQTYHTVIDVTHYVTHRIVEYLTPTYDCRHAVLVWHSNLTKKTSLVDRFQYDLLIIQQEITSYWTTQHKMVWWHCW